MTDDFSQPRSYAPKEKRTPPRRASTVRGSEQAGKIDAGAPEAALPSYAPTERRKRPTFGGAAGSFTSRQAAGTGAGKPIGSDQTSPRATGADTASGAGAAAESRSSFHRPNRAGGETRPAWAPHRVHHSNRATGTGAGTAAEEQARPGIGTGTGHSISAGASVRTESSPVNSRAAKAATGSGSSGAHYPADSSTSRQTSTSQSVQKIPVRQSAFARRSRANPPAYVPGPTSSSPDAQMASSAGSTRSFSNSNRFTANSARSTSSTDRLNHRGNISSTGTAAAANKSSVHLQLEDTPDPQRRAGFRRPKLNLKRGRRIFLTVVVLLLVFVLSWPIYLVYWANSKLGHVEALSSMASAAGETWLIAGTDARSDGSDGGIDQPWVEGSRTDTLMLIRKTSRQSVVVSLPRDTAVEVTGHGLNKLNAAYTLGGPQTLVSTIETLTGVKVDHYVQVSMGAVTQIVDAVGGVELCYDQAVQDPEAELDWPGGCNMADGKTALAFSRMRKFDPKGDIGRQERQRQVITQLVSKVKTPSTFINPFKQRDLADAVTSNLTTDPDTGLVSLAKLALTYSKATKAEMTGTPPISSTNYREGGHGAMVQLDPNTAPAFWSNFKSGTLQKDQYYQW